MLSLLLVVCMCQIVLAVETSADAVTHVTHNASQYFAKGRELYKTGKYTEAMITLKKAVEENDAWAAALIGRIYAMGGDGIKPDMKNAVKWANKATEMGYPASNAFFAELYAYGISVPKNTKKAYQLIHDIENLDIEDDDIVPIVACVFYMEGIGTPKDLQKAEQIAQRIKDDNYRQNALKKIAKEAELNNGIPASTLISEVRSNQMRFNKNYKGRQITALGFVGNIDEKKGGYTLSLFGTQGPDNPFSYIECRFPISEEGKLLELNRGDSVRIRGIYKGKEDFQVGAIVFHNCVVVN